MEPQARVDLRIQILASALELLQRTGGAPGISGAAQIAGVDVTEPALRRGLEHAYREAARLRDDPRERIRLVDRANEVRPRSLV